MKNYILAIALLISANALGQIQSVTLQASGLTCSMCSRAIYKALGKVPDVRTVREDIENTSYHIQFADPALISLEKLQKAVSDAGFSVARMEVNANIPDTARTSDSTIELNHLIFHFVNKRDQNLQGEKKWLILDKDYLLDKDRRKYASDYESIPVSGGNRIFHAALVKS